MKLETQDPAVEKRKWKIVRRDTCVDVEGEISYADEDTGKCKVIVIGGEQEFDFGQDGIRIVRR